ncbi:hypothetical protein CLM71_02445 [Serratia sp. MYb239]|uniref:hypothetical protein n=1 Tax=Serratia sp. MYb239 TaxID=2033438 RepID=UPI000CF6FBB1|nr:hypothetical protein [Serratia sp. MYb239]AVJ16076.1 hypothetical protein CLM71_02445 [Serratia sp. MYb239]
MPLKTVIKWFHYSLTAVLLIVVIGFVILNADGDKMTGTRLVSSQQLSDSTWLYVTEYSGGGATVANSYRYYLSGKLEGNVNASLAKQVPFLVAAGSAANVSADGDIINIKYSGRVFSFSNSVVYEVNGKTQMPNLRFEVSN